MRAAIGAAWLLFAAADAAAEPVVFSASGANAAAIQGTVDAFRAALGGANNGVGGSFETGRREINWDGVPDAFASPNLIPGDFFNVNSPRGIELTEQPGGIGFLVSADSSNPTATPVEFGEINPNFPAEFATFSPQRLFTSLCNPRFDAFFFVPGTATAAQVAGFGAVFTDVDTVGSTRIDYFDASDGVLLGAIAPAAQGDATLSFLGVVFTGPAPVARVSIQAGEEPLGLCDGVAGDHVAIDDLIYGEPVPEPSSVALAALLALAALARIRTARSG